MGAKMPHLPRGRSFRQYTAQGTLYEYTGLFVDVIIFTVYSVLDSKMIKFGVDFIIHPEKNVKDLLMHFYVQSRHFTGNIFGSVPE